MREREDSRLKVPYGGWRSPLSAASVAGSDVSLGDVTASAGLLYWIEGRPTDAGRQVLVRRGLDGTICDVSRAPFNVRTRVHEYGGGAYLANGSTVYFSHFSDQRVYRQSGTGEPEPWTPEPIVPGGARYADLVAIPQSPFLVAVRELHSEAGEVQSSLIVLRADEPSEPREIAGGHDFCSSPTVSADGRQLAWLVWDHPRMPWDGTELWVGHRDADGFVGGAELVAGGAEESVFQPTWGPDGRLYFISDRSGWWNLYRWRGEESECLVARDAEFGVPQWTFGMRRYAFLPDGRLAAVFSEKGTDHLGVIEPGRSRSLRVLDLPYTSYGSTLAVVGNRVAIVAAAPSRASALVSIHLDGGLIEKIRLSSDLELDPADTSQPEAIEFPGTNEQTTHAFFYSPANQAFTAPDGERPPLLVVSHGGPTSATRVYRNLAIQYWTTRGIAVVDVNYGGSTGYGRAYRQRLKDNWGIVDVQDCLAAALFLAAEGRVDAERLAIRGGSAGGFTTLCALTFHAAFAAGASYYGVADCETLARDTHKFESRYLDGLIGPYPEARAIYEERSPINHVEQMTCPVILFQGREDRIVPVEQAEQMVRALRRNGVPFAYLAFEGEQHGFRQEATIRRALEAETYFYARVLGFPLADPLEEIPIENLA